MYRGCEPLKLEQNAIYTKEELLELDLPKLPFHITQINANNMWKKGVTGKGITVGIIDTGCDINHFLLKGKIKRCVNLTDEGENNDVTDTYGHGTHIAGIIASKNYKNIVKGVAPNVELVIYKVVDSSGRALLSNIAMAINDAAQTGVDILNISLSSPHDSPELYEAIKYAIRCQVSIVCSAGNNGDGNKDTSEIVFPACYEEVISVGATNQNNDCVAFSNTNQFVDCVASGVDILSTYPNDKFQVLSGTSQSAPIVVGALALLKEWSFKEYGRKLSEIELYGNLIKNTISIDGIDRNQQGNGYVRLSPHFSKNKGNKGT